MGYHISHKIMEGEEQMTTTPSNMTDYNQQYIASLIRIMDIFTDAWLANDVSTQYKLLRRLVLTLPYSIQRRAEEILKLLNSDMKTASIKARAIAKTDAEAAKIATIEHQKLIGEAFKRIYALMEKEKMFINASGVGAISI